MEFAANFKKIRKSIGYTLDRAAEALGVSRQTIQKWESGGCVPEMHRLEDIAERFGVSLDYLVLGNDTRDVEQLRQSTKVYPDYKHLNGWELYQSQLHIELRQSLDEGLDVEKYRQLFEEVQKLEQGPEKEKICDGLFDIIRSAEMREGYKYVEPDDYPSIKKACGKDTYKYKMPSDDELKDKLLGAWYGRICGCMLGKPVEGWKRDRIHSTLKEQGNWPLCRYISTDFMHGAGAIDDDTNYTVLSSVLIDKYGFDFTAKDVADIWLNKQPKDAYCTAERVAYRNFMLGYLPPASALYKNPYREYIGAQIRTDYYGYVSPCDPAAAAELAFRDASISHVKNGIYGAMFAAAMLAAAAGTRDMRQIVLAGITQVPTTSRLYEYISNVVKDYDNGVSAEQAFEKINTDWDEYCGIDWCHTISNAAIVAVGLLYGGGDYTRSICMAVSNGFDTDCNGATIGSVIGMSMGSAAVGEDWKKPLCGQLDTSICGMARVSLDSLAAHTMDHVKLHKTTVR